MPNGPRRTASPTSSGSSPATTGPGRTRTSRSSTGSDPGSTAGEGGVDDGSPADEGGLGDGAGADRLEGPRHRADRGPRVGPARAGAAGPPAGKPGHPSPAFDQREDVPRDAREPVWGEGFREPG